MQTCGGKRFGWHLSQLGYIAFSGIALSSQLSLAQVVPDATLGNETSIVTPSVIRELPSDRINGGAVRGNNLFHSFREFNVGAGRGIYFANPDGVARIFTRVTGNNLSQILGTLGVLGNADLFLINPNGIIFGPNAKLDLNGSFIGSTASKIRFADSLEFSATNPQGLPLLSVNVPVGLQYGTNPGRIVNQSTDGATNLNPNREGYPIPRLSVAPGRTFALIGGDVLLEGGTMGAFDGRIELGSVDDKGYVGLSPIAQGWALNYEQVQNFGDINLTQSAIVDTSGERGGDIQIRARNLTLKEGAVIYYAHEGSQIGGNIDITTTDSVELVGGLNPFFFITDIPTYTEISAFTLGTATGATGNVTVKTRRLTLRDGAFIGNASNGDGNAGNLTVLASELVELIGVAPEESLSYYASSIISQAVQPETESDYVPIGNGGNIIIETKRLLIQDGGLISSATYTAGQAGNVTIKAGESVELIGTNPDPGLSGGIATSVELDPLTGFRATGNGGNLTIQTRRLLLQDGGQIASSTRADGNASDVVIDASESVELIGTAPNADLVTGSSGLFVSAELDFNGDPATGNVGNLIVNTRRLLVQDGARISADNFGTGTGGDLRINTRELSIQSGGTVRAGSFGEGSGGMLLVNAENVNISGSRLLGDELINSSLFVSGEGSGAAGSLEVNAARVQLDNNGRLAADSMAGSGNIRVQARDLLVLRGNSGISTNSTGKEPGGNIELTTNNLVALGNSDITANATNSQGGRVTINATGIFGLQYQLELTPNSDITATGGNPDLSGIVEINTPDLDVSSGLVNLPTNVIDVAGLVAQNACAPQRTEGSSFVVTGRGGLPPNPTTPATNEVVIVEWARVADVNQNVSSQRGTNSGINSHATVARTNQEIIEAQGWVVAADGKVVLTAGMGTATPPNLSLIHPSCDVAPIKK